MDHALYANRDISNLGEYYTRHARARLIGFNPQAELGWRDREIDRLKEELAQMRVRKDEAYLERNTCVAMIARMALKRGYTAGIAVTEIEGWSPEWHGCVYVELPTGQASWHYHDSQKALFANFPPYPYPWDGHTTPEKYKRVRSAFPI